MMERFFSQDVATLMEAITLTCMAASVVLVIVMVVHRWTLATERCSATHRGWRCVHDERHPGSHRDEDGNYWNDPS